jgi:(2Fe-2S) ferredoxin
MPIYSKHIFFCTNQKADHKKCCQDANAKDLCHYFKSQLVDLNLHGAGKFRVSSAGCLGRCAQGPNIVIYPDNVWYKYSSKQDLDKIINNHIINGKIVDDLKNCSQI